MAAQAQPYVAENHVASYFLGRKRTPGSWSGGVCPSKKPVYFQRSLQRCILCHLQAFCKLSRRYFFFHLSVFICICTKEMTLHWAEPNEAESAPCLYAVHFSEACSIALWGGFRTWSTKSCLISIHMHTYAFFFFCGWKVSLCPPVMVSCVRRRRIAAPPATFGFFYLDIWAVGCSCQILLIQPWKEGLGSKLLLPFLTFICMIKK